MSRKRVEDLSRAERRKLDKQYGIPHTPEYRNLRIIRVACLLAALVCAFFATPLSPFGSDFAVFFAVIGNILIVVAIVLDATKMRKLRDEYIDGKINNKSKEARRAEKAARATEKEQSKTYKSIEEQLEDDSLSYWEKIKLRARLSAVEAQEDPRERRK